MVPMSARGAVGAGRLRVSTLRGAGARVQDGPRSPTRLSPRSGREPPGGRSGALGKNAAARTPLTQETVTRGRVPQSDVALPREARGQVPPATEPTTHSSHSPIRPTGCERQHPPGPLNFPSNLGSQPRCFCPWGYWVLSGDICGSHTGGAPGIEWVEPGMLLSPQQSLGWSPQRVTWP